MKKIALNLILFLLISSTYAQDFHFSQFYNSPLTLNPALTGKMRGGFRFAANYRNQWFSTTTPSTPFATYSGSFDTPIRFRKDALGLGLVVVSDIAGQGVNNSLNIIASAAYHKALDKKGRYSLSFGVQAGFGQKRIKRNELLFYNEIVNGIGNSGETNLQQGKNFFDLNAGLMGSFKVSKKSNIYGGFSMYHLTRPKFGFYQNSNEKIGLKYIMHGGMEYQITKRVAIVPSIIYITQSKADELNLGTAFVFKMSYDASTFFTLGAYYRATPRSKGIEQNSQAINNNISDAIIAYTSFEFKNLKLGFSYDATVSDLASAPGNIGSFEASIIYINPFVLPDAKTLLFCPRF